MNRDCHTSGLTSLRYKDFRTISSQTLSITIKIARTTFHCHMEHEYTAQLTGRSCDQKLVRLALLTHTLNQITTKPESIGQFITQSKCEEMDSIV